MLIQKCLCNRINSIVIELHCEVTIVGVQKSCEKFFYCKKFGLNDFIIEDLDSADFQTNPTQRRGKVSGFGKFLTSFFARLFAGTEAMFTLVK